MKLEDFVNKSIELYETKQALIKELVEDILFENVKIYGSVIFLPNLYFKNFEKDDEVLLNMGPKYKNIKSYDIKSYIFDLGLGFNYDIYEENKLFCISSSIDIEELKNYQSKKTLK